jgi:hypothetical protein
MLSTAIFFEIFGNGCERKSIEQALESLFGLLQIRLQNELFGQRQFDARIV